MRAGGEEPAGCIGPRSSAAMSRPRAAGAGGSHLPRRSGTICPSPSHLDRCSPAAGGQRAPTPQGKRAGRPGRSLTAAGSRFPAAHRQVAASLEARRALEAARTPWSVRTAPAAPAGLPAVQPTLAGWTGSGTLSGHGWVPPTGLLARKATGAECAVPFHEPFTRCGLHSWAVSYRCIGATHPHQEAVINHDLTSLQLSNALSGSWLRCRHAFQCAKSANQQYRASPVLPLPSSNPLDGFVCIELTPPQCDMPGKRSVRSSTQQGPWRSGGLIQARRAA